MFPENIFLRADSNILTQDIYLPIAFYHHRSLQYTILPPLHYGTGETPRPNDPSLRQESRTSLVQISDNGLLPVRATSQGTKLRKLLSKKASEDGRYYSFPEWCLQLQPECCGFKYLC